VRLCSLRYRLLPMLYSAAAEAHRRHTAAAAMRLEWPSFPEAADASQYLLGTTCSGAVCAPARGGAEAERAVPLPPGSGKICGRADPARARRSRPLALLEMPLFVRRGGWC
jgi:alpha-glucosidase (family GH31 glycosyl hydrolase)